MTRPMANEMVKLRKRAQFIPDDAHWKVTARYTVDCGRDKFLRCVRVASYSRGGYNVLHFTEEQFNKLFISTDERRKAARS